jgi:fumarate reductase subunit C
MSARTRSGRGVPTPPPRRGLLSGMSAAPMDSMPRIRTAFTRGLAGTWSSPLIVGSLLAWLLAEWLVVVALGYPGPFALFAHVSAPVPLSTFTDLSLSTGILGVRQGLLFVFGAAAVHALWFSVLAGLAIETIESGSATRWGAIRGLRAFPVVLALHVIGVAVVFAAQIVAALGGGGLALIVQMAALVVTTWVFAFAPVIAVIEHRRLMDCLGRSIRAARMPGSGNLTFAAIYAVPIFATFLTPGLPGVLLDVNPPYAAWTYVVLKNLRHAAIVGAFAFRYLAIAEEVPDAPVGAAPSRDRASGKGARGRR